MQRLHHHRHRGCKVVDRLGDLRGERSTCRRRLYISTRRDLRQPHDVCDSMGDVALPKEGKDVMLTRL